MPSPAAAPHTLVMTLSEARAQLSELVGAVADGRQQIIITRYGAELARLSSARPNPAELMPVLDALEAGMSPKAARFFIAYGLDAKGLSLLAEAAPVDEDTEPIVEEPPSQPLPPGMRPERVLAYLQLGDLADEVMRRGGDLAPWRDLLAELHQLTDRPTGWGLEPKDALRAALTAGHSPASARKIVSRWADSDFDLTELPAAFDPSAPPHHLVERLGADALRFRDELMAEFDASKAQAHRLLSAEGTPELVASLLRTGAPDLDSIATLLEQHPDFDPEVLLRAADAGIEWDQIAHDFIDIRGFQRDGRLAPETLLQGHTEDVDLHDWDFSAARKFIDTGTFQEASRYGVPLGSLSDADTLTFARAGMMTFDYHAMAVAIKWPNDQVDVMDAVELFTSGVDAAWLERTLRKRTGGHYPRQVSSEVLLEAVRTAGRVSEIPQTLAWARGVRMFRPGTNFDDQMRAVTLVLRRRNVSAPLASEAAQRIARMPWVREHAIRMLGRRPGGYLPPKRDYVTSEAVRWAAGSSRTPMHIDHIERLADVMGGDVRLIASRLANIVNGLLAKPDGTPTTDNARRRVVKAGPSFRDFLDRLSSDTVTLQTDKSESAGDASLRPRGES